MAADQQDWRKRYLELQREGEALGHRFGALGDFIARRLTDRELIECLRDFYAGRDTPPPTGGSNEHA